MADVPIEVLEDLIVRLKNAAASLDKLAAQATQESQASRLSGKADGLRLAQSYLRETFVNWIEP